MAIEVLHEAGKRFVRVAAKDQGERSHGKAQGAQAPFGLRRQAQFDRASAVLNERRAAMLPVAPVADRSREQAQKLCVAHGHLAGEVMFPGHASYPSKSSTA